MNRREFVKYLTYAGLALGVPGCLNFKDEKEPVPAQPNDNQAQPLPKDKEASGTPQLIITEGSNPSELIAKGFALLGGIEKFVRPGNIVVIKPNFSVARTPEEAATTNALLVAALVRQCLQAKAKEVRVIDHTLNNGKICLEKTGMHHHVSKAGGKAYVINNQTDTFYTQVTLGGEILKTASYSSDVLKADVFINFPILKHHNGTKLTMGLKNLMGLVWDRGVFHSTNLNKTIAELAAFKKPHLTILDATRGISANGPMGPGPIKECNQVVFSTDMLTVDAYGAHLFGINPTDIGHLNAAVKLGLGSLDWQRLQLIKASV